MPEYATGPDGQRMVGLTALEALIALGGKAMRYTLTDDGWPGFFAWLGSELPGFAGADPDEARAEMQGAYDQLFAPPAPVVPVDSRVCPECGEPQEWCELPGCPAGPEGHWTHLTVVLTCRNIADRNRVPGAAPDNAYTRGDL